MPRTEHLVLCGGMLGRPVTGACISLNLHGKTANVHLKITDINRRLLANVPDALVDLLEIASYIYAADGAIRRGGRTDAHMGMFWRRKIQFVIPVRLPSLWSSIPVMSALVETLSFLSDDEYDFEFRSLANPPTVTDYFEFFVTEDARFTPDEIVLFSGGLDSLSGTLEDLVARGKKVALVSHRSSPKIVSAQRYLVERLQERFGTGRLLHVPVWVTLKDHVGKESTHRTRAFLFAALGTVVARLFKKDRICFFENGVVSINLPPVAQVVGARATRTTHPQTLAGFRRVLTNVLGRPFDVDNPFLWLTKAEVIKRIAVNGHGDLIRDTRSCTRTRDMTTLHPHCGRCSQCLDRRFSIIAAGQEHEDPPEAYKVDLFLGSRHIEPDREMALAYVRSASDINQMTDAAFFARYGETSRIVGCFPEPADVIGSRIFDLYRRHAAMICKVFERAIKSHAPDLLGGKLPTDCLLLLVVSRPEVGRAYPVHSDTVQQVITANYEIRIAIDVKKRRVFFNQWGFISGASAALIIALSSSFREAARAELAPEHYPYVKSADLARQTRCDSDETLRRRIHRCRANIAQLAKDAGDYRPSLGAVIENQQWHGYRLNPDAIRIVVLSELSGSG